VKLKSVEFAGAIGRPGTGPARHAAAGRVRRAFQRRQVQPDQPLLERHRKQIARVSAQPGKTQEINFYRIRAELTTATTSSSWWTCRATASRGHRGRCANRGSR
jgi:hypothetical protein